MVPERLLGLFAACREAGGRALLVGGSVRDALMGQPCKDLDIEVHGLPLDRLLAILRGWGTVNEVGRSFGVLKLRWEDYDLDVSLPRRDSRQGTGHRGILASADPDLGVVEAARRRDLTINAIAFDPLRGAFEDPFHGRDDLGARLLRAVDATTFGEDPLRALRVVQFAGRFRFRVDPALLELCRAMPLHELPAERIRGEVEKLLLKSPAPSVGWAVALAMDAWSRVLPEWDACPPEVDRCAVAPVEGPRRLALLYAAACCGGDRAAAERVLDRLKVHRQGHYRVRDQVLFLVGCRSAALDWDDTRLRTLAEMGEVELLGWLVDDPDLRDRASALGVARAPLSILVTGRDVPAVPPGPELGRILARIREEQLQGRVTTREEALEWLRVYSATSRAS